MRRAVRLSAPLAWMGIIWVLSSVPATPNQTMAGVFIPKVIQKGLHVVFYAVLCALWLWAINVRGLSKANAVSSVGLTTAYAVVDEFHQTFTPGRFGSPWDVVLDAAAAGLAVLVVVAVRKTVRAPQRQDQKHGG